MKNLLLSLLLFQFNQILIAQEVLYTFELTNQTFEELVEGISVNNGEIWDENSNYQIPINFDFKVNDVSCSSVNVSAGSIDFVGQGQRKLFVFWSPFGGALIKDKGETESLSPISYKEETIGGNKVLKIEYKNAGFIDTPSNTVDSLDFTTYQIWLIENVNQIKIVYGPSQSTLETYGSAGQAQGPFTKLLIGDSTIVPIGFADNPSYDYEDCSIPCYGHIEGTPSNGIVYNFLPEIVNATSTIKENNFSVYPNPAKDNFIMLKTDQLIDFSESTIYLLNSTGTETLVPISFGSSYIYFNLNNLANGVYFIMIRDAQQNLIFNHKILKL